METHLPSPIWQGRTVNCRVIESNRLQISLCVPVLFEGTFCLPPLFCGPSTRVGPQLQVQRATPDDPWRSWQPRQKDLSDERKWQKMARFSCWLIDYMDQRMAYTIRYLAIPDSPSRINGAGDFRHHQMAHISQQWLRKQRNRWSVIINLKAS